MPIFLKLTTIGDIFLTLGTEAGFESVLRPVWEASFLKVSQEFLVEIGVVLTVALPAFTVLDFGEGTKPPTSVCFAYALTHWKIH